jgi:hypothetical protein
LEVLKAFFGIQVDNALVIWDRWMEWGVFVKICALLMPLNPFGGT